MASTTGTGYFSNLRDSLTGLVLDVGRAKLIDVERQDDDRYMYDSADMRYRSVLGGPGTGGMSPTVLILGAVAIVGGLLLVRKFAR